MTTAPELHARIAIWVEAQHKVDYMTTTLLHWTRLLKLAEARALLLASAEEGPLTGKNQAVRDAQFAEYLETSVDTKDYREARQAHNEARADLQAATTRRDEAHLLLQVERELLRFRTAELGRPDRDEPVYVFGKPD